jgi:hypothetical protein
MKNQWQPTDTPRLVRLPLVLASINQTNEDLTEETVVHFLGRLHEEQEKNAARNVDPWLLPLGRVRGKIDFDGLERVTSQKILDLLEIPQRSRRAPVYRRLAKLMAELGWTAVRVRDMTPGGYLEQVRGYCRNARNEDRTPAASAPV